MFFFFLSFVFYMIRLYNNCNKSIKSVFCFLFYFLPFSRNSVKKNEPILKWRLNEMIVKKNAFTFKKKEILKKWKGILHGLCIFFQLCLPNNSLLLRRMIISSIVQKNSKKGERYLRSLVEQGVLCSAKITNFVSLLSGVVVAVVIKITFMGFPILKHLKQVLMFYFCLFVFSYLSLVHVVEPSLKTRNLNN